MVNSYSTIQTVAFIHQIKCRKRYESMLKSALCLCMCKY